LRSGAGSGFLHVLLDERDVDVAFGSADAADVRRSGPALGDCGRGIVSDSCACGRLSGGMDAFQPGRHGASTRACALLLVSSMMEVTSPRVGARLLFIAGIYQLTPMKQACLRTCQSPFGFLMSRWHTGLAGAFRVGLEHGFFCVGCCWALMLLLFVGGVMNLGVIAALTVFVAFEKLARFGVHGSRIAGVLVMAAGCWMLVR
jgi:Predicted metal-binding integral membrane protein (DUF2182)